ncbi:MAG: glycosyltransferase [Candidatus Micrarchaeota archaeon]|nr:glycosyltransferase [Candidatus Micrarchaeota archaeon]
METLDIVFYTDSFIPAVDGVVTSILNFKHELERRGHNVYVFAAGDQKTRSAVNGERNVFVMRGMKFRKYPQYNLPIFPMASSLKVRRIRPDILHAHTPFGMGITALLMSRINRTPVVGTFHTMFTDRRVIQEYVVSNRAASKMLAKYSWAYAKYFYTRCDGVIAPSRAIEKILTGKNIDQLHMVPNSVDLDRYNRKVDGSRLRKRLQAGTNDKVVLYVGRMSKEKDLETLIKAAAMLKNEKVRFVFAGAGPALDHYRALASRYRLDGKANFVGFVNEADLPRYYAACDLFCTPSTFETQGLVAIEAMACGKPVVGAAKLALNDLIRNGRNGEKFRPGDSRACAGKIDKVINSIASYKGMTDTAKGYSIGNTTDLLLKAYKEVIYDNS